MKAGFAEIERQLVDIDDVRIDAYIHDVGSERVKYDIRSRRGISEDLVSRHAGNLVGANIRLMESFGGGGEGDASHNDAVDEIMRMAVLRQSSESKEYAEAYAYVRPTRIVATEYGPDSSPAFQVLQRLAVDFALDQLQDAFAERTIEPFSWGFSRALTNNIIADFIEDEKPAVHQLYELAHEQGRVLNGVIEQTLSAHVEDEAIDPLDYDTELEDLDPFTHEPEANPMLIEDVVVEEPVVEIIVPTKVDIALLRFIKHLDYLNPHFLDGLDRKVVSTLLTAGATVLQERNLIGRSNVGITIFDYDYLPDDIETNCRPSKYLDLTPVFFTERGQSTRPAKDLCNSCPAKEPCATYAIDWGIKFGVWGGLSERERRKIRKEIKAS